ncbi:8286_t:CDS:1 [Paraglomus occultum]|uniref:8286_t:CDS:1 n=1 Tax=Paraglomus occultum TaxID=144539 RepID=A0A9N8WL39_9GLOM|nr:8286_t:CDS:1 [Paraglomus occultum]
MSASKYKRPRTAIALIVFALSLMYVLANYNSLQVNISPPTTDTTNDTSDLPIADVDTPLESPTDRPNGDIDAPNTKNGVPVPEGNPPNVGIGIPIVQENPVVAPNTEHQFASPTKTSSDSELYLAYNPHSGFHNQRIALQNAIFISWYLNRTLLVPPIILVSKIGYSPYYKLQRALNLLGSAGRHISDCDAFKEAKRLKCLRDHEKKTLLDWDYLIDLSWVEKNVRIMKRPDFVWKNLMKSLNIKNEAKEVYIVPDNARYYYKYYDSQTSYVPLGKYQQKLDLSDLASRTEKLIQFNTLFGSGRIALIEDENISFYQTVKKSLVINNPKVIGVVNRIVNDLGGTGAYIGLHVRGGDASFKQRKAITVETMKKYIKANWEFFAEEIQKRKFTEEATSNNSGTDAEKEGDREGESGREERQDNPKDYQLESSDLDDTEFICPTTISGSNIPLFVATDLESDSPELATLRKTFSCLLILNDFNNYLSDFDVVNPADGVNIRKQFFPFIDLVVASKGGVFVGTKGSTFSGYSLQMFKGFGGKFGTSV